MLEDIDGTRIEAVFTTAVASWIALRHALVSGDDPALVLEDRRRALELRDLRALEALLAE